jgi:hypothetical protein
VADFENFTIFSNTLLFHKVHLFHINDGDKRDLQLVCLSKAVSVDKQHWGCWPFQVRKKLDRELDVHPLRLNNFFVFENEA